MITCTIIFASLYLSQPATVQDCFDKTRERGDQYIGRYLAVGKDHDIKIFKYTGQLNKYVKHQDELKNMVKEHSQKKGQK